MPATLRLGGHAEGNVYWLDEFRDGLIWRVQAFLHEKPLAPFRPQRFTLSLLNSGDGDAVLTYGPLVAKGRWARRLKDRIDTRMAFFPPLDRR